MKSYSITVLFVGLLIWNAGGLKGISLHKRTLLRIYRVLLTRRSINGSLTKRSPYHILQMLRQRNRHFALGLLGCVILLSTTTADNSVHILSKYIHQPLTSTTLRWLPVAHYSPTESREIVIGGFENVSDGGEGVTTFFLIKMRITRININYYYVTLTSES